jgi:hypothetical protein
MTRDRSAWAAPTSIISSTCRPATRLSPGARRRPAASPRWSCASADPGAGYERQGILVEEEALDCAGRECLAVSLPATFSPGGMMRRFWVVLAFGALTYEVEHRQLELDELSQRAEREGGVVGGLKEVRNRVEEARNWRAALVELLPDGTPDDWVAIGSAPLFDEYVTVAVVVVAVVVVPLVLFGVELTIVRLLVAGGIVARSALGRPWVVVATPSADPADALAWEVRGWRRSSQLIEEVEAELAAGINPSAIKNDDQAMPASS